MRLMARDANDAKRAPDLTAEQVIAYLRDKPEFFSKHPEALDGVQAPARELGTGVADLQRAMIGRLRNELGEHSEKQQDLLSATRANLQSQGRIHECVLALLAAKSFAQLIQVVTNDFAVILDLDIVSLCVEAAEQGSFSLRNKGVHIVPPGTVDLVMPKDRRLVLRCDVTGDPEIFGAGATLVRSDALVRLSISPATPPALLALGSRDPEQFDAGLGTELLDFLSSVLEHVIQIWLHLPE
jgi:uncharacterized protein YigA (DUF484 family)